ncbi:MAG: hypothetical protein HYS12_20615 [Planctomycetes bacterium]|nr:hypothetical protein [Planctomycetota bacterium]
MQWIRFVASLGLLGVVGGPATLVRAEDKPVPLKGPVVIEFSDELDKLTVPRKQFGIFRNEEPKTVQWIEEAWTKVKVPGGKKPLGFLDLKYEVPQEYNGWWLKLGGADWSKYRDGSLVLRLRPGTTCTTVFKLELKTGEPATASHVYVRLNDAFRKAVARNGYGDVAVSLDSFGIRDWTRMRELVLVFESSRIPVRDQKGNLLLHSIRLVRGEGDRRGLLEGTSQKACVAARPQGVHQHVLFLSLSSDRGEGER